MNILSKISTWCKNHKIIVLVILGIILLRLIISFAKDVKEEYRELPAQSFIQKVYSESNTTGGTVTINYPESGVADVDNLIQNKVHALSKKSLTPHTNEVYNSQPYTFKHYTFVGFSNTNPNTTSIPFETLFIDKHAVVKVSDFLTGDYTKTLTDIVREQLSSVFPNIKANIQLLVANAIKNETLRMASNGLVLILPTKEIIGAKFQSAYYEVLIPKVAIEPYLK